MPEIGTNFSDVILSGGTGRSGTTIIGKLLSRHSQIGLSRPSEIKMLTSGNGLLDLHLGRKVGRYRKLMVNDRLHLERFRQRLFHDWWEREPKVGELAGLIQGIEREELEDLYISLKRDWKQEKSTAPCKFLRAFIDSQKLRSGKLFWIDTTPVNLFRALDLADFLPGAHFIHMVRDGRDVISSVIREPWGPSTYEDGLDWYRNRMTRILTNTALLKDRVLTISLEELALNNRDETLARVLAFLNLPSEPKLQLYFDSEVSPEKVRQGRWKNEVADMAKFNESYFRIVAELREIDPSVPLASS
ncbi:MAG: sulfotransferase [Actinobacteria bacterium]|nr:sulfotransferase [Actinomycetota bacterium]